MGAPVIHKGKPIHHHAPEGQEKPPGGRDFFGYGEAIRSALDRRLPRDSVWALDVGTGFGRNAVFLARHLAPGSRVCTVDPSEGSLKRGEKALREAGLGMHVTMVSGAVEHLPFADGAFHLTMGVMIFHHLVKVPPALREMGRVTRSEGKLLLVDWGPTAHLLPFAIEHRADDFFTARAVVNMLHDAGLRSVAEQHPMWYVIEAVKE
jgi:ubiquinone/menaquinone biosynthesis C-methylase UbiE